ncbi:MAG: ABC transporter permease [Sphingobium sp.]
MNEVLRAAFVIARRDFTALVRSKAFIAFLVGPILMLAIALAAGAVGAHMVGKPSVPVIGIAMAGEDGARLLAAGQRLDRIVGGLPVLERVDPAKDHRLPDPIALLGTRPSYMGVLSGTLGQPRLDLRAGEDAAIWPDRMKLAIDEARRDGGFGKVALDVRMPPAGKDGRSGAAAPVDRSGTAQFGQMALFLSTMLLAGMVLSNLVEEKTNKIIEILASSIPLESIFLGKLFAMLAMALIAIGLWVGLGAGLALLAGSALPALPAPAVGWPVFLLLGALYFSTAYLLLGSAYLSIGAMAATVRDVQTLSMPVSMAQLVIFLLAGYAMARPGSAVEIAACLFPFTSPFALIARAAQVPELWPHGLLLAWQALWTWAIIRIGTELFRRNVMKSRRGGWRRRSRKAGAA